MTVLSYTKNTVFKRVKFKVRKLKVEETAESFITTLHKLSIQYDYGVLRDELIRVLVVAGMHRKKLSE